MEIHPNDPDHGDRHTWDQEAKIEGYRLVLPRFSSEFGHQSPPCWPTVVAECLDETRDADGMSAADLVSALRLRQKAWGGDDAQYKPYLEARFRAARDAREYVAQTQHLQARAMDAAMRWLRAGAPRSMGALIWQWNDVWAGHSWSLVDVAGRAKPAWHAVRRACAQRLLSIEPIGGFEQWKGGALEVVLADDAAFAGDTERLRGTVVVERVDFRGNLRARAEATLSPHDEAGLGPATARARVPAEVLAGAQPAHEMLVARLAHEPSLAEAAWFLAGDSDLRLPEAALVHLGGGVHRAAAVVREFWIEEPASDTVDSWRTLFPGDEVLVPSGVRWWSANHFAKTQG
jgi:beta-mannosidase